MTAARYWLILKAQLFSIRQIAPSVPGQGFMHSRCNWEVDNPAVIIEFRPFLSKR